MVGKMAEQRVEVRIARCMRGCHIYNGVWTATVRQILHCVRKTDNVVDCYAVSVVKDSNIVDHLPKKGSKVCSFLLLRCGGSVSC